MSGAQLKIVCYTAVFSVVTQRSSKFRLCTDAPSPKKKSEIFLRGENVSIQVKLLCNAYFFFSVTVYRCNGELKFPSFLTGP